MRANLTDRVAAVLSLVIEEELLPRFRALRAQDIFRKASTGDPEDVVTVVDQRVEARLTSALVELLPGSIVVGEEAVHARPALLDALAGQAPVWVVDPLDGTKNFARGDDRFGVMVALVERGTVRAGWIALPVTGRMFVAEAGSGTFADGVRLRCSPSAEPPRGTLYTAFMPHPLASDVDRRMDGRFTPVPPAGSAAIEYTAVAQGSKDFAIYYKLEPWDHAAGALLIAEAGGCLHDLEGRPYAPAWPWQTTILASTPALAKLLRRWLVG
jgi:fructose-1,6-bisphosphatase/inositol monophosphatase family enzyme